MAFTITGPDGTAGLGNITIPKTDIPYGINPVVYIDGRQALNQGYTQDVNNFYIWYTTLFGTNLVNGVSQVTVQFFFPSPSAANSLGPALAMGIVLPEIVLVFAVIAVKRFKRKPEEL